MFRDGPWVLNSLAMVWAPDLGSVASCYQTDGVLGSSLLPPTQPPYTHTHTHTPPYTYTHTHTHTLHACMHAHTHHPPPCTHACTHARAHTHTHTHTHHPASNYSLPCLSLAQPCSFLHTLCGILPVDLTLLAPPHPLQILLRTASALDCLLPPVLHSQVRVQLCGLWEGTGGAL